MAAAMFAIDRHAPARSVVLSVPRNQGRSTYSEVKECCDYDGDTMQTEKKQRSGVQKKRHKAKAFHVQHKAVPSAKISKFFERVTDPGRAEREAMMAKDPFGRMEGRW